MEVDAVIVGAGAVGLSLALALSKQDYRVLLIEQRKESTIPDDFQARTLALSYASKRIFESLSIWESLAPNAIPIHQVLVSMKGQYGTSRLNTPSDYDALGYVVGAHRLEGALINALLMMPNVILQNNSRVISRQSSTSHWELIVEGINESVFCKLLIAADGAQSQLRQEQRIGTKTKEYDHYALLANLEMPSLPAFTAMERFLPKGAIALLPWQQKLTTCVWTTTKSEAFSLRDLPEKEFITRCEMQLGKRLGNITRVSKRLAFPLTMTVADNQISARFLLMGNAAHNLHPIAAQGLNLSLRDVWQLHSQLVKSKTRCDLGAEQFLQEYITARMADQHRVIFATDKIAKFMSGILPGSLRAMGITLFDCITPLKKQFVRMSMGLP